MPLYRASLQTLGALLLLALALACHGTGAAGGNTTGTISGTVTYQRVPLVKDANGVPTGLADSSVAANLVSLPARGVQIRIYQQETQTNPDGTTKILWSLAQSVVTNSLGAYSTTTLLGKPTMVEVLSTFDGGGGQFIPLIADSNGITSSQPPSSRVQYALRKAVDGSAPANAPTPSSTFSANSVVNFTVGLEDVWWITNPETYQITGAANVAADLETDPIKFPGHSTGTGSRVLGIGDTIASYVANYGSATPGATLLLHYWPGQSEPGGSFIVYDRSLLPLSQATNYYFGTLRGGPANDDAWDEGVILPLLARSSLYAANLARSFGVGHNPIIPSVALQSSLSPDMARIEGLAQAMAANVLKSPYLADTQGTSLAAAPIDIRDIGGLGPSELGPLSAPAIRALAWELILKANSLTSPGTATDWSTINPLATSRFFLAPSAGAAPTGSAPYIEPLNIFDQLNRFKEGQSSLEPVNLAAVLTDPVLTSLGTPYGIPWPRPTTGVYSSFVSYWGADPTGALPPVVLSMAKAAQVNTNFPTISPVYPNTSAGEVFFTWITLSADLRCTLSATISPALAAGVLVDVDLPLMPRTFSFSGSGGTSEVIVIPVYTTAPVTHPLRIHMKSPAVAQPEVTVTLTLTPVP